MGLQSGKTHNIETSYCLGSQVSHVMRKRVLGASDQVRHKPGCTAKEDGQRLEISDLGRRGIVLSM